MSTFNATSILIDGFLETLDQTFTRVWGGGYPEHLHAIRSAGTMAMEIIANSNALYHNVEHSMMVTLVGQEILRGRFLRAGGVSHEDWTNFVVSLLCHDIGYVRGICPGDRGTTAVINDAGDTVAIPIGATDAFLTPHHIERGKIFVLSRFRDHAIIDAEVIARNIEKTRFPVPAADDTEDDDYPGLVRAADLIGQLADPDYLKKLAALFYEFDETGANEKIGCKSPEDLREDYPDFYWKTVSRHVHTALDHLRVTREGRLWIAGLFTHIFSETHRLSF